MIEHCLIYCCLGGKSLYKNYLSRKGEFVLAEKRNVLPRARVLNGTVCFSCDIEKVEEIENTLLHMAPTFMHETKKLCDSELLRRACLTPEEADEYMPKHALFLSDVKEIEPMPITNLHKDGRDINDIRLYSIKYLTRAPQNMCWAWVHRKERWERVLILSIQSKNLVNIANGKKDIETRRQVVNEIKEMEK